VIDQAKAKAAPTTNTSSLGAIEVSSSPEHVHVYIDNTYVGESPGTFSDITPGQHEVRLEADGYLTFTKTVMITAGETTKVLESMGFAETPTKKAAAPDAAAVISVLVFAGCGIAVLRRK
jgi:hypothetical protein